MKRQMKDAWDIGVLHYQGRNSSPHGLLVEYEKSPSMRITIGGSHESQSISY